MKRLAALPLALWFLAAPPLPAEAVRSMVNAYVQVGLDDAAWQKNALSAVAKVFAPKSPAAVGKKTVVVATISRSGRVAGHLVHLSSGSKGWDDAAVAAVTAAKIPPLPAAYPRESVEVHFHFAAVP